jgi:serine-type D-Ala-D-Ala carboxypeptidase
MSVDTPVTAAWDVVWNAVRKQELPGAVALVQWRGKVVLHEEAGWAAMESERRPMDTDTIFDLASLTKPLVTAPLVLQLADRGAISLDEHACRYLPAMARFAGGQVTVRQLLTHTSGLPAWSPLYVWAQTSADALRTIAEMDGAYAPGSRVVYSCLGYIILGLLLEEVTGQSLAELARCSLVEPLDLRDTGYGQNIDATRCAWTECGNRYEQASVATAGLSFHGWREEYIPGTVHDGNAWYAMGGISGNAGLFGTARDVGVLGQMWLDRGKVAGTRVLSEGAVTAATADCTPGLNEARGLGWQVNRPVHVDGATDTVEPGSAGTQLSERAFGHTGFTGTSLWIDPDLNLVAVLLTNRVHPTVGDAATIRNLRSSFHDALVASLRGSALDTLS